MICLCFLLARRNHWKRFWFVPSVTRRTDLTVIKPTDLITKLKCFRFSDTLHATHNYETDRLFVCGAPLKLKHYEYIYICISSYYVKNLLTISHSCIQWWSTYDHCKITADAVPEVLGSLSMTNTIVMN